MLPLQWKARYIEVLAGRELVITFEHATNPQWRCWYTLYPDGDFLERQFYV